MSKLLGQIAKIILQEEKIDQSNSPTGTNDAEEVLDFSGEGF